MMTLPVCMAEAKEKDNSFFLELYQIKLRTQTIHIVAADEDIHYNGQLFTAIPFKRGEITRSIDSINNEVTVELGDCTDDMLAYVMNGFDFRGCKATIIRILYPESIKDPNIFSLVFTGELDEPEFQGGVFSCKIQSRFPNIQAPARDFQIACNSEFGDTECRMNKDITELTVSHGGGNNIIISASYPENYWTYGSIIIGGEWRVITASTGNTIRVNVTFAQNINGKKATLARGCNKTLKMCRKYGNTIHYSGFPAIPFESEYR